MSVYSMTGYASGQQALAAGAEDAPSWKNAHHRLGLELRSVNSRFLDLGFRLSDDLRQHEPALRALLNQRLKRGKVELRAYLQSQGDDTVADPPPRLLQRLASVQDQVRVWLPDAAGLSVADVLRVAGGGEPMDDERTADALFALAKTVLDDFVAAREREGERLVQLIRERVAQLRKLAAAAAPLVPEAVQAQKQRFLARWQEALTAGGPQVAPEAAQDRALAEATAFAIRIDVAEELGRLTAHLDEIDAVLKKGGEVGKRLDFLIQELHREANTLGSKSAALELTRISVDMKVLIEQMREQVQNIE
ncbi:YicC/YloC family endoribonuclease [Ottowia testudinis]|uniref:YicC family protein n=1 Tax=Ottowia testudinis TaxID=2816950 RepID=A0A975H4M5_9BURK|nr:YicC/YloC family endoribonuclease [Ottowia testudinis]QTD44072.1 YicC family protein [Ottowia testudinis]